MIEYVIIFFLSFFKIFYRFEEFREIPLLR